MPALQNWADVEESDEDEGYAQASKGAVNRFETKADEQGIKTVIEYTERDGKTYKVTKKVKTHVVKNWTNRDITVRKSIAKFGKVAQSTEAAEKHLCVKSEEDVMIELTKKPGQQDTKVDDAEDKFFEESLAMAENLTKQKKVWTEMNRDRQLGRDEAGADRPSEDKPAEAPAAGAAPAAAGAAGASRYVPPSLRAAKGDAGKGTGKGANDFAQQQEASLRITNLSEDCREGDLQDLFGQCGRLQRVYLAKDQTTFQSRGFAFVTYYTREDAQRAIDKLNGHGYDNLILQVQFAKPRA